MSRTYDKLNWELKFNNKFKHRIEAIFRKTDYLLKRKDLAITPFFTQETNFNNELVGLNMEKTEFLKKDYRNFNIIKKEVSKEDSLVDYNTFNDLGLTINFFSMSMLTRVFSHLGCVQNFFKPFWKSFLLGKYYNTSLINLNYTIVMFKFFSFMLLKLYSNYLNSYMKLFFLDENIKKKYLNFLNFRHVEQHYYSSIWFFGNLTNISFLYKKMNQKNFISFDYGFPFLTFILGTDPENCKFLLKEFSKFNLPTIKLCDTNSSSKFLHYIMPTNTKIVLPRLFYLTCVNKILKKVNFLKIKQLASSHFETIFRVVDNPSLYKRKLFYSNYKNFSFNKSVGFNNDNKLNKSFYYSFKLKDYFIWPVINRGWLQKVKLREEWGIRVLKDNWEGKFKFWSYINSVPRTKISYEKIKERRKWEWRRKQYFKNQFNSFKDLLKNEKKK